MSLPPVRQEVKAGQVEAGQATQPQPMSGKKLGIARLSVALETTGQVKAS